MRKSVRGRVHHREFSSEQAAQLYLAHLELLAAGVDTELQIPLTLGYVCESYLRERERLGRSPHTLRDYGQTRRAVERILGMPTDLRTITDERVLEYVERRRREGAGVARILKELKQLQTMIRRVAGDARLLWRLPDLRPAAPEVRIPRDSEVAAVYLALDRLDLRRAFLLGLLTGIRPADVLAVPWSALRFRPADWPIVPERARILDIRQSKRRGVAHPTYVVATLAGALFDGELSSDAPIVGLAESAFRSALRRRVTWGGVQALRRVCATWLSHAGLSDPQVGVVLGHAADTVARRHYIGEQNIALKQTGLEAVEQRFLAALEVAARALPGARP